MLLSEMRKSIVFTDEQILGVADLISMKVSNTVRDRYEVMCALWKEYLEENWGDLNLKDNLVMKSFDETSKIRLFVLFMAWVNGEVGRCSVSYARIETSFCD